MSYHLTGMCCSCGDALEMLEEIVRDNLPKEVKNEEFSEKYEKMLNRVRYSLSKQVPTKPVFHKGKCGSRYNYYTCGHCGFGVRSEIYAFCPNCGQQIDWAGFIR